MKSTNSRAVYENVTFEEQPYYKTDKFSIHIPKLPSNNQTSVKIEEP
jgi:hypothetical protein